MPGSPNTSFIPKHTPNKAERRNAPRQLFLGTLIVRVLFFAVLIAAIGVFAYDRKLTNQLAVEVSAFEASTSSFEADEEKVEMVQSMDKRLAQANNRLENSVSLVSLLTAVERATILTAQIKKLSITRGVDESIALAADIKTDTFDSVIFQRTVLEESEVLKTAKIEDVIIQNISELSDLAGTEEEAGISFQALITVANDDIPIVISQEQILVPVVAEPAPTLPTEGTLAPEEVGNVNGQNL